MTNKVTIMYPDGTERELEEGKPEKMLGKKFRVEFGGKEIYMTNNLKELDKILEQCPTCKGDGFTSEHEDGCDGNCNFCPVQVQCDHCHAKGYYVDKQDVLTLIDQKEKEARIDELEHMECCDFQPINGKDFVTNICSGDHETRIKQLKEELKEKGK